MAENDKYLQQTDIIDLRVVAERIWDEKKLFLKVLPIVFVVSCIYILGVPRTYTSEAKLAPEMGSSLASGTLGSIASSFGFDIGDAQTTDAITPFLYPDLMEDNGFVVSLFSIKVKSQDGTISTNYHDYLKKHQKSTIWTWPFRKIKKLFKRTPASTGGQEDFNAYILSEPEDDIANAIRGNIKFSVDKKTGVITIQAKAQDALICKTLADSVMERLQTFITDYRTSKARTDYKYYKDLTFKAKQEYEKTRLSYASFADASTHVSLRSAELKMEDMENEMQLKFNAYTTLNAQLQAAEAKVQERTPAFTKLKGAAVPIKASGPKRMLFVLGMLILASFLTALWITRKDISSKNIEAV